MFHHNTRFMTGFPRNKGKDRISFIWHAVLDGLFKYIKLQIQFEQVENIRMSRGERLKTSRRVGYNLYTARRINEQRCYKIAIQKLYG